MYSKEEFDQLFSEEKFQDDILNIDNSSKDWQNSILTKYSLSEKEFVYARKFFSNLSFRKEELNSNDVNYALKRLKSRIANTSASQVKKKQNKIGIITWIYKVAAVLSVPLLLSTIYFYKESRNTHLQFISKSSEKKSNNIFEASLGARTQVGLPDGSLVWLNSGSSLSCPTEFSLKSRNVELKGEAFFEVMKNEKVPMIVSTGNLKVKVYGTKFNLKAFPDDRKIETTLMEGKVSIISDDGKTETLLNPGYSASYSVKSQMLNITKVEDMEAFIGWREGRLLFHNERFADIIKRLERWYNVDIQLSDASLGNYILYATFFDENIEQILDIFSGSIPIRIEYPKRVKNMDGVYSKRQIIIRLDTNRKTIIY